jgi:hypothetical protein
MVDPAGVAFGALSLAGVFTDVVDCFHYVKVGKSFPEDYKTSVIHLDTLALQLNRWGESIGLTTIDASNANLSVACTEQERQLAQDALNQMHTLFKKAYDEGKKLTGAEAVKEESTLSPNDVSLRELFQRLSLSRLNESQLVSVSKKAYWALVGRQELESLIGHLQRLVHQLSVILPPPTDQLLAACHHELEELTKVNADVINLIKEWASKNDHPLREAIEKFKFAESGVAYTNTFQGDNNQVSQAGNNYGTSNVNFGSMDSKKGE